MSVKQVIVIRKDLKMRRGKEIAQGAHAAMAWLTDLVRGYLMDVRDGGAPPFVTYLSGVQTAWIEGIFKKVCVQVNSEAELDAVFKQARAAHLEVHTIEDAGLTEFHGVKTKTCLAIGPDEEGKIDAVTGHLKPY